MNKVSSILVSIFCIFIVNGWINTSYAQEKYLDSLIKVYEITQDDSAKVNLLTSISLGYSEIGGYAKALDFAERGLKLSQKINHRFGEASSYNNFGIVYDYQSDYDKAMEYYLKSLKIFEEIGNKKGAALIYNNVGIVYENLSDYARSLDYYFKSLKLKEGIDDKKGMAYSYNNIGNIYEALHEYKTALDYYLKGLKLFEETNNSYGVSGCLINVGNIYFSLKDYTKALEYLYKGLKLYVPSGDKNGMSIGYLNIASLFVDYYTKDSTHQGISYKLDNKTFNISHNGLLDSAHILFSKALTINEELGNPFSYNTSLMGIGQVFFQKQKYKEALGYFQKAYSSSDSIGALGQQMELALLLSNSFRKLNNYESALTWFEKHIQHRDSLFNMDKQKEFGRLEAQSEYDKELLVQRKEQEKKEAIHKAELEQKSFERNTFIGGFILVLLLAVISLKAYRNKRNANELLSRKNSEIITQKEIIEEKNKDITDSINYAKRIQDAMLPFNAKISQELEEHFIFFRPKDIVSGDFYWYAEKNDKIFIAVVDCTGHGVPGAFMSMIGSSILNQVVGDKNIHRADLILNEMHKEIRDSLKQAETDNRDGMDVVLCAFDKKNRQLEFSGAMNSLYILKNGEIITIPGDRFSIGGDQLEEERLFTLHKILLNEPQTVYLSSDGIIDQFGGDKGKKLGKKQFKELLLSLNGMLLNGQGIRINEEYNKWKGNIEQIDDVCVIGLKI